MEVLDQPENSSAVHNYRFLSIGLYIWISIVVLGQLFKVMHWPGSSLLILVGTGGLMGYCMNGIMRKKKSKAATLVVSAFSAIWFIYLFIGAFFLGGYPYNTKGLIIYIVSTVIFSGIQFTIYQWRDKSHRKRRGEEN